MGDDDNSNWMFQLIVFLLIVIWVFADEIRCNIGNQKACQTIEAVPKKGN